MEYGKQRKKKNSAFNMNDKTTIQLPPNFHENIINYENALNKRKKSIDNIIKLIDLYKVCILKISLYVKSSFQVK